MKRKFVQLLHTPETNTTRATLYAVADDGTAWAMDKTEPVWKPVKALPDVPESPA